MSDTQTRPTPAATGADHAAAHDARRTPAASKPRDPALPKETDGPTGPEPTRFGDWERKGRCLDF